MKKRHSKKNKKKSYKPVIHLWAIAEVKFFVEMLKNYSSKPDQLSAIVNKVIILWYRKYKSQYSNFTLKEYLTELKKQIEGLTNENQQLDPRKFDSPKLRMYIEDNNKRGATIKNVDIEKLLRGFPIGSEIKYQSIDEDFIYYLTTEEAKNLGVRIWYDNIKAEKEYWKIVKKLTDSYGDGSWNQLAIYQRLMYIGVILIFQNRRNCDAELVREYWHILSIITFTKEFYKDFFRLHTFGYIIKKIWTIIRDCEVERVSLESDSRQTRKWVRILQRYDALTLPSTDFGPCFSTFLLFGQKKPKSSEKAKKSQEIPKANIPSHRKILREKKSLDEMQDKSDNESDVDVKDVLIEMDSDTNSIYYKKNPTSDKIIIIVDSPGGEDFSGNYQEEFEKFVEELSQNFFCVDEKLKERAKEFILTYYPSYKKTLKFYAWIHLIKADYELNWIQRKKFLYKSNRIIKNFTNFIENIENIPEIHKEKIGKILDITFKNYDGQNLQDLINNIIKPRVGRKLKIVEILEELNIKDQFCRYPFLSAMILYYKTYKQNGGKI